MTTLFLPAVRLMGRLRYAYKIVLVPALLLVPLGLVTKGYVDIQGNQVSFSAKERDGLAYLKPLTELTARTVSARRLAVSGKDASTAGVGAPDGGALDRREERPGGCGGSDRATRRVRGLQQRHGGPAGTDRAGLRQVEPHS
jgi:hypothetical protein